MADSVRQELVFAYDCQWCEPYTPGAGPVTHCSDGPDGERETYAEHWYSRDRESLRPVLMFVFETTPVSPPTPTMLAPRPTRPAPRRRTR